ncbi:hypothetical protein C8R44DRAFT_750553 [Mycena epipterygia]|nr:hypothetical protein C8R44DRAFT_750553 [Mycena epipterygia]
MPIIGHGFLEECELAWKGEGKRNTHCERFAGRSSPSLEGGGQAECMQHTCNLHAQLCSPAAALQDEIVEEERGTKEASRFAAEHDPMIGRRWQCLRRVQIFSLIRKIQLKRQPSFCQLQHEAELVLAFVEKRGRYVHRYEHRIIELGAVNMQPGPCIGLDPRPVMQSCRETEPFGYAIAIVKVNVVEDETDTNGVKAEWTSSHSCSSLRIGPAEPSAVALKIGKAENQQISRNSALGPMKKKPSQPGVLSIASGVFVFLVTEAQ